MYHIFALKQEKTNSYTLANLHFCVTEFSLFIYKTFWLGEAVAKFVVLYKDNTFCVNNTAANF